ncbi:extracellular solute-binding protein [Amphibacillus indicireducens]|uniref:ABC transporter substrate-binding protein n=1 Tax=Amphibacillus indicireducens TaxID=1076330 RepID=A0ABP7V9L4_9BACI
MKIIKSYRYILYLLVAISFLFVACQNNEPTADEYSDTYDNIYLHPGLQRYDEEVDVSFVGETSDNLRELEKQFENETLRDNRWTRLYHDILGININYDWIAESAFYHQRLANDLASGRLPDIIRVDALQMRQLANAGLIQELSGVYNTYATPFTKEVLSQEMIDPIEAAMIDQKLMGIPDVDSSLDAMQYLWIRQDWLDNLNIEPPETMADVLAISEAFTHNDPDQNGENDTFGLAVSDYWWNNVTGLVGFMAGFEAYPNIWLKDDDGTLVYGGIQPEVKEALSVLREMYIDGQIDPEFMFKDGEKVKEQIINNEIGMLYGEQWASFFVQESLKNDPDADWQAYPIMSATDQPPKMPITHKVSHFWVVRADYEHPEVIIKLINLHLEKNWGQSAEYDSYYSTPHPVWQLSPVRPFPTLKNLEAFRAIEQAKQNHQYANLEGEAKRIFELITLYDEEGNEAGWGWKKTYGSDGAYSILESFIENDQILYDELVWPRTETMVELNNILSNRKLNMYQNIILGEPLSTFEQFVEEWYDLGGREITNEINELYLEHQDN